MGAKHKVRFHHTDGTVTTEPLVRFAIANNTTIAGARALLTDWLRHGHIRERADGGYDVIRFQPRQAARG